MTRKSPKRTRIKGDVNISDGDFVAGDKTIVHGDDDPAPGANNVPPNKPKRKARVKDRDLDGGLEVTGGDVVFGDKVIKFFQDNLNIYVFRDARQLALFLIFLLLVSGGIGAATWYLKQPQKMTGNYNIAIAQFGEIQADGSIKPSGRAEKISSSLFNFLDSEYQTSGLGLTVQISHKNMPLIQEDAQAKELARKVHADIVIYGNIFAVDDQAELTPRFYVAEHRDTQELTGQNELAFPIPFNISELGTQDEVNRELKTRSQILLNFTKALVYLSQKDLDAALRSIQTSMTAAEQVSQPFAGREVIYLLAYQIQTSRKNQDAANEMIDKALDINDQYARAYLARGNSYYSQAVESNFDPALLQDALTQYQLAYEMPNQPDGAYIPIKAKTAFGNVLVIQAQQTSDPALFDQAIENYTYVVDEYERTQDPFLRNYASIAYFGLGAAYERQGETEQAVKAYEKAYDLTEDPAFKARIEQQIKTAQNHGVAPE